MTLEKPLIPSFKRLRQARFEGALAQALVRRENACGAQAFRTAPKARLNKL